MYIISHETLNMVNMTNRTSHGGHEHWVCESHLWFSEFLLTSLCTCQIGWVMNTCFSHPWTWLFAPNDRTLRCNVIEYGNFSLHLFLSTVCFCGKTRQKKKKNQYLCDYTVSTPQRGSGSDSYFNNLEILIKNFKPGHLERVSDWRCRREVKATSCSGKQTCCTTTHRFNNFMT